MQKILTLINKYYLIIIANIALYAMLGSLYFSEVLSLPPCNLCWYQRILTYPIVVIAIVAHLRKDLKAYLYILPLAALSSAIGFFQYLLQKTPLGQEFQTCSVGVPCNAIQIQFLGFITIPLLAFMASFSITLLCVFKLVRDRRAARA